MHGPKSDATVLPAESFLPALKRLADILTELDIRFHLTGGLTSIAYGEPRMTQDVDLVLDPDQVRAVESSLLDRLARADFEFSANTASAAITAGKMFQVLDSETVVKLDLYVRCLIPGELERSVMVELFPGTRYPVVSRADAVLSKLIWIQHGSHRSRRDLRRLMEGASAEEGAFVRNQAGRMSLDELLEEVLEESDELNI